jgi:hypothetical protein
MNLQNTLLFTLLIFLPLSLFSQDRTRKWGDIPESDLKMTIYPQDSGATSVVLQDVGKLVLEPDGTVNLNRVRRIKILDVSALDQGNLMIPYYDTQRAEELRNLDVQVTTPDGVTKKVKSDNVFTQKLSRYWSAKKVFIPDLKKGSVIEYRYDMRSGDYISLYDWYFQDAMPVRWSELQATIPDYFDYIILRNIPHAFDVEEVTAGSQSNNAVSHTTRWGLANLPALIEEPFTTTIYDYRNSIKFQLRTVMFPGHVPEKYVNDWKTLAEKLIDREDFGLQYKKSNQSNDLWKAFSGELVTGDAPEEKAAKALRFIQKNMKWNGEYAVLAKGSLDNAFEKKSGSSAELNLALVALLRKADVNAVPLLLSTRGHGQMYSDYPFQEQFNSVIVLVQNGEKITLLDATQPFLSVNQLSLPHYNGAAWMVDKGTPNWLDIRAPEASQTWYGKMQLNEEGELLGSLQIQTGGNRASEWRAQLDTTKTTEFLQKKLAHRFPDAQLDSIEWLQLTAVDQPLSAKFKCRLPAAATVANDFIYCEPIIDFWLLESPFKSLTRSFPVEFEMPFKSQYVLDLTLPKGYSVEDLPEPARVNLPDNAGKMSFSCSKNATGVQVILKMNLAKTTFASQEYGALKQFYEIVAEKTKFQLVLKKV